jgi:phosphoribosylglycinamide formyltransferase-1
MSINADSPLQLAVWASGTGTNAMRLHQYFKQHRTIRVGLIVSNRIRAEVLTYARQHHIPFWCLSANTLSDGNTMQQMLQQFGIDAIALAGYLRPVPAAVTERYEGKLFNIHPALLPDFGGKGMYGLQVHRSVCAAKKPESGITIHLVNSQYDEGKILFQTKTAVPESFDPEELAQKIQALEHQHYARVIEQELMKSTMV